MLLLYAVVPAGSVRAGLAELPLHVVEDASAAVVFEETAEPPVSDRSHLLAFGERVAEIARTGPALPFRFGSTVAGRNELRRLLHDRAEEWRERLTAVADHVELLVHVDDDTAPQPAPAGPGAAREYLLSRVAASRHRRGTLADLVAALRPVSAEQQPLRPAGRLRLACLVPASGVDRFHATVRRWAQGQEGLRVRTTGPWPPYSFTATSEQEEESA